MYFECAVNITQEILEALKGWLKLSSPWDIYLKTMLALEDIKPTIRQYKRPTNYQKDLIARTLRQIREHKGSMLVASTGLGKTVVAGHISLQLYESREITNIMVIGPKQVTTMWEDELRSVGIFHDFFTFSALDKPSPEKDKSLEKFNKIVDNDFNDKWLITAFCIFMRYSNNSW